ncbi:MAG: glycosyltransferase, partial [Epsilonproteobacteria bacterium]|nr:glycosyltransferase [Campylobacterota bacterium]
MSSEYKTIKKSGLFDEQYYLKTYEDVRKADIDPIKHYIKYGWREGRNPSERFNTNYYLDSYPDVRDAGINPLVHFIRYGSKEGRSTHSQNSIVVENKVSKIKKLITIAKHAKNNPIGLFCMKKIIRPIYQKFPFLRKIKNATLELKDKFDIKKYLPTSSSHNKLALDMLTERRFKYTDTYFSELKNSYNHKELPNIDISIVTYNSAKWINQFINSLIMQVYPLTQINLYFIDHESSDDTLQKLEEEKKVHGDKFASWHIFQQDNLGFGTGHDKAIRSSQSEFCLITNIDLIFEQDAILNVVTTALTDEIGQYASWELRQIPYEHPKYYDPVTLETNWSSH